MAGERIERGGRGEWGCGYSTWKDVILLLKGAVLQGFSELINFKMIVAFFYLIVCRPAVLLLDAAV